MTSASTTSNTSRNSLRSDGSYEDISSSGSSVLGLIFLSYCLCCLALVLYLSERKLPLTEPAAPTAEAKKPKPAINVSDLPDFAAIGNVRAKKSAFFNYLRPLVEQQNQQLRTIRQQLRAMQQQLLEGKTLKAEQRQTLEQWAREYKLSPSEPAQYIDNLLVRADELPEAMVLAQAAMESAWGTSRFARNANNLFGQWCFQPGCGLVPQRRAAEASHEVKVFASVTEAVAAYYLNINTHPAYRDVRVRRVQARLLNQPLRGTDLVAGLEQYSERGLDYIDELRRIIRVNRLEPLPTAVPATALTTAEPTATNTVNNSTESASPAELEADTPAAPPAATSAATTAAPTAQVTPAAGPTELDTGGS